MAAGSLRLAAPLSTSTGEVWWLEGRPSEAGRTVLVRQPPGGSPVDVTPAPFDVRSRVHEYGGGAYTLGDAGEVFFVNGPDQAVYRQLPGQAPVAFSPGGPRWRFGDLTYDRAHRRLLAIAEQRVDGAPEPRNLIVALAGDPTAEPQELVSGADFYASPTLRPDGGQLAFVAWNHPHMPWDAAALYVSDLDPAGRVGPARHVAGDARASAQQPVFGADGALYFLWEPAGAWNLHRVSASGVPEAVGPATGELGLPLWQLGMRSWGLQDANTALCAEIRDGVTALVTIDLRSGARTVLEDQVTAISHLHVEGGRAVLLAGFADRAGAVVLRQGAGSMQVLQVSSTLHLPPGDVSRGVPFTFPTSHGDQAHGFFYPPRNQRVVAPPGELPPLLLLVHGGPTAATAASYSPAVQFWTTRGFAVFDLNYRGSTGHGRRYRDRLNGQWGIYDVDDCLAAARALAAAGKVDPRRMAIRGSSAGGYTVLAALCRGDLFHAGSSLYGVSDLAALARDTHKFESRYLEALVGPWPARADLYAARSPLHQADRLNCPVIFFQGREDQVVPPSQTERLVEALAAKGLTVEYHPFEGEQHGFRRADTIRTVYASELTFFGRVFGFSPG